MASRSASLVALELAISIPGCKRARPSPVDVADANAAIVSPSVELGLDPQGEASGALAWANWGDRPVLFHADEDDEAISTYDATTLARLGRFPLPSAPRAIRVAGGRVFVALPTQSQVLALRAHATDVGGFDVARTLPTRAEPVALTSTATELIVVTGAGHALERFALANASTAPGRTVVLPREPRSVLALEDDVFAVGHASSGPLTLVRGDVVEAIDLVEHDVCTGVRGEGLFCDETQSLAPSQHYALAALAGRIVAPGALSMTQGNAPSSYGGGGLDVSGAGTMLSLDLLPPSAKSADAANVGPKHEPAQWGGNAALGHSGRKHGRCALPRSVVIGKDGTEILVACLGSDQVVRLGLVRDHDKLAFSTTLRSPLEVPGAPAALARRDDRLIVFAREARTLAAFTFTKDAAIPGVSVSLPLEHGVDATWRRGRALFHSSRKELSNRGLSCAHCHPDGRDDDNVWDTPSGKRRPLTLVGVPARGLGWEAQSATLEAHLQQTLTRIGGRGLPDADAAALLTYVRALRRPQGVSPEGGPELFVKAGCPTCHDPKQQYSDGQLHDVGLKRETRTPRLIGLGGRRAFFHDGRYASIAAMLGDEALQMGRAKDLSEAERGGLVAWLESL